MEQEQQKDFESTFLEETSKYKDRISELSIRMRNIREVPEVQVELFSDRQRVLEYLHRLGQIISKLNKEMRKRRKEKLIHYGEGKSELQKMYGSNEKNVIIEGDLAELKYRIDIVNEHIGNMNETIKTIDHMLFGMKTRIQFEEFMRVGTVK